MPDTFQMLAHLSNLQTPGRIVMLSSARLMSVSMRCLLSLFDNRTSVVQFMRHSRHFRWLSMQTYFTRLRHHPQPSSYSLLPVSPILLLFLGSLLIHPLKIRPLNPKLRRFRLNHILFHLITEVSHLVNFCLVFGKRKRQFRSTRHIPRPRAILQLIILVFQPRDLAPSFIRVCVVMQLCDADLAGVYWDAEFGGVF